MRVLAVEQVAERLEDSLKLLRGGSQTAEPRHRTLRATLEWSHELLSEPERKLFGRLSVFAGGWTLDAAEEVCSPGRELGIDMLDGLSSLVDKSLVRPVADDGTEAPAEPRFSLLQVIREFAAEKLDEEPDAEMVRRRHAEWVVRLAETARPELRRNELRRWQHRLRREEENLRTALRWALERGEAEIGLRTASAVWDFWHYWAEVREGIAWLESLIALPAAAAPTDARARGLDALGGLVYWQGKPDRAWDLYEEAVAIRRGLGDDHALADALFQTAWAAAAAYDLDRASERANQARDLYEKSGDTTSVQLMTDWILIEPVIAGAGGDPETAIARAEATYEVTEELGRAHDAADWLTGRAMIHRIRGDPASGLPLARDSIATWYELGNLGRLPLAFKVLAALELQAGEPGRAVRLEAAARRLSQDLGGDLYQVFGQLGDSIEEARPLLDPEEHARAIEEGRTRSLAEQVAYALRRNGSG
jgi:tetratricopeptide (TPR) repeat protein